MFPRKTRPFQKIDSFMASHIAIGTARQRRGGVEPILKTVRQIVLKILITMQFGMSALPRYELLRGLQ